MKKLWPLLILPLAWVPFLLGAWDNTLPADISAWNNAAGYIRNNWDALEDGTATVNFATVNNILAHGAIADDDVDDSAAIQAALDEGGYIYIPEGTFNVATVLTYDTEVTGPVRIGGAGPKSILKITGITTEGLKISAGDGTGSAGQSYAYVDHFQIKSATSGNSVALLHFYGIASLGVHSMLLEGSSQAAVGILFDGAGTYGCQQGEVADCAIFSCVDGIKATNGGANGIEIHGCTLGSYTGTGIKDATNSSGAFNFMIHHNHFVSGGAASKALEIGATSAAFVEFSYNLGEGVSTPHIDVLGGHLVATHNSWSNGSTACDFINISAGSFHDISHNVINGALDVTITAGTPSNFSHNKIFGSGAGGNVTISGVTSLVYLGNLHFGTGTETYPDNTILAQNTGVVHAIATFNSDGVTNGDWGISVQGLAADKTYLKLRNAQISAVSTDTYLMFSGDLYPDTDDTHYLGENSATTPHAWKGVVIKDTANGHYYTLKITNGAVALTDLGT